MSQQRDSTLVFFIPGIMGSTLRYCGVGEYGELRNEDVWSIDIWRNADILATKPDALSSPDVQPGEVIHFMRKGGIISQTIPIYSNLIKFCLDGKKGLGLREGKNFFPFPYDWRADNVETAKKLADFIGEKDASATSKLKIIAHSMGGIVARLMLLQEPEIAKRTELFFQIASPIKGSAKAYYTLKERLCIHKIFDQAWILAHRKNPTLRARLLDTLRQFKSIYQLLPPNEVMTVYNRAGNQYSALADKI